MTAFSTTIEIAATPQRVWSVMCDVARWHEWTASVTRVRVLGDGPLREGRRALVRQPRLPPAMWTVTELVEGKRFTWVSRAPGIRVTARHVVEPAGSGTRATLSIHYGGLLGPLLARLTRGINARYIALEAEGLRRRSEAGAA